MSSAVKSAYASSSALTITLASLASSSTLVAGRSSVYVDNTSNLYLDYKISGKITTGTSPTAGTFIEVWAYTALEDTPTWPDTIAGTDAAKTLTSVNVKYAALKLITVITIDSSSNETYYFGPYSLAWLPGLGGNPPFYFGVFVVHNTGVNLNSTGGNHAIWIKPDYDNVG